MVPCWVENEPHEGKYEVNKKTNEIKRMRASFTSICLPLRYIFTFRTLSSCQWFMLLVIQGSPGRGFCVLIVLLFALFNVMGMSGKEAQ